MKMKKWMVYTCCDAWLVPVYPAFWRIHVDFGISVAELTRIEVFDLRIKFWNVSRMSDSRCGQEI
jgi:hypothetical protein